MRTLISLCCILIYLIPVSVFAQDQITVSGIVSDSDGLPLPGAHVFVKDKEGEGTVTNAEGYFVLSVDRGDEVLIRYLGFEEFSFVAENESLMQITLEAASLAGDEVVVVGYGTQRKSDLTGSIASVGAEELSAASVSSLEQGIQGKVAGTVVVQTSGQPGAGSTIRIRGTSSINGNNEPLYVIDGVPIINDAGAIGVGAVQGPALNPLASINPSDIVSVDVLKDASATAIYGARGANGVILITTKRGTSGRSDVVVDYYTGFQQISNTIDMLNARQLAELGNEAADNAGVLRRLIYASPNNLGEGTDWQDQIFRIAPISNYQISISGGTDKTNYSLSGNYFDQQGIIISSGFQKGNLRLNLDQRLSDKIKISTSLNLNRSTLDGVVTDAEQATASSITSWALEFNPGLGVFNDNGEYTYENNTSRPTIGNPVQDAYETQQLNSFTRLIGNTYLEWNMLENVTFKSAFGVDGFFNEEFFFMPNFLRRAEASNGQAALGNSKGYTWLMENTMMWKPQLNENHQLDILAGHTLQQFESDFVYAATSDFEDNRLGYYAIQNGAERTLSLSGANGWQLQSFLARANYIFNEKYLVTISGRVDGSSKFGAGNKYGIFPSFASAWKIGQEDFMQSLETISDMKLRVGYGVVGNEGIPPYSSLGTLEVTEAYFGENDIAKGAGPRTLNNSGLRWETTSQINIGMDLSLFNYRIQLVADYYSKYTRDLLLNAPVPYTSGFRNAFTNVGELRNYGFEFAVESFNLTGPFEWVSNFNIGFNENRIVKLTGQDDAGLVGRNILGINGWTRITEGQPVGTFYGFVSDGIVQLDDDLSTLPRFPSYALSPGDRKYVDQNGDGILDENDRVVLGDANPDFTFGLSNTFSYRNFRLEAFFQGVYGNQVVNFNRFSLESFDGTKNNSTAALERWTPDNPTNKYPRANATPPPNVLSDVQVEDGAYIRLQTLTLSYDLPESLLQRLGIRTARVYVRGNNLWLLTNYTGYDPEVSRFANDNLSLGADLGSYPRARLYMAGITMSL